MYYSRTWASMRQLVANIIPQFYLLASKESKSNNNDILMLPSRIISMKKSITLWLVGICLPFHLVPKHRIQNKPLMPSVRPVLKIDLMMNFPTNKLQIYKCISFMASKQKVEISDTTTNHATVNDVRLYGK